MVVESLLDPQCGRGTAQNLDIGMPERTNIMKWKTSIK
jgi:hypothetical protein